MLAPVGQTVLPADRAEPAAPLLFALLDVLAELGTDWVELLAREAETSSLTTTVDAGDVDGPDAEQPKRDNVEGDA